MVLDMSSNPFGLPPEAGAAPQSSPAPQPQGPQSHGPQGPQLGGGLPSFGTGPAPMAVAAHTPKKKKNNLLLFLGGAAMVFLFGSCVMAGVVFFLLR